MKMVVGYAIKIYIAQAVIGFSIGFAIPWLHFFKVLT